MAGAARSWPEALRFALPTDPPLALAPMTRDTWIRIFLVLHVLGAITGLGTNLTYGPILAIGNKAGAAQRAFALKAVSWVDRHMANPAYGAQLVTGLTLVVLLKLDLLGAGCDEAEYAALAKRSTAYGIGVTIAVVLIVVLMVWKPDFW